MCKIYKCSQITKSPLPQELLLPNLNSKMSLTPNDFGHKKQ